jgi:hypothetical protein
VGFDDILGSVIQGCSEFSVPVLKHTVTWLLKAGRVEQEELAVARKRCGKHVSATRDNDATIEDAVFSMRSI